MEDFVLNVDSVEELSNILVSNAHTLVDKSTGEGNGAIVNSVNDNTILDSLGEGNGASWLHWDELVLLSSQEVLEFYRFLVSGWNAFDWEMSSD